MLFTSPVNIWSRGVRTCDLRATEWETSPCYFLKKKNRIPTLTIQSSTKSLICISIVIIVSANRAEYNLTEH